MVYAKINDKASSDAEQEKAFRLAKVEKHGVERSRCSFRPNGDAVTFSWGCCVLRSADGGIGHAAGSGGRHEGVGRKGGVQEQAAGESGPHRGVAIFVNKPFWPSAEHVLRLTQPVALLLRS